MPSQLRTGEPAQGPSALVSTLVSTTEVGDIEGDSNRRAVPAGAGCRASDIFTANASHYVPNLYLLRLTRFSKTKATESVF